MKRLSLAFLVTSLFFLSAAKAQDQTDPGWPRMVSDSSGTLIYYQPQMDDWTDYKQLSARMAFSLTPKNGKQILGVASLNCEIAVNKEERMVYLNEVKIPDVRFPTLSDDSAEMMANLFKNLLPKHPDPISLDRLMAEIDKSKKQVEGITMNDNPPPIFYSASPAILLIVDGKPALAPVDKTDIQFVVNTNWDLFFDKKKDEYYLLAPNGWLKSKDFEGPWKTTQTLPKDFEKLPAGENFDDVKKMIPPPPPSGTVPKVFFSDKPGELILLKGAPVYTKISGTSLMYIANTDNDIFLDNKTNLYYVLLSGRWFSSKSFSGPWTYAGNKLPADFAKIPNNSPKADVLPSVPGTTEASDAVLLAQIPQTAIVNKAEAEAKVKVNYDGGNPQFARIEKTDMLYATNTAEKVIKVGDLYYLCFQAVWFMSTSPQGPWKTADSVPKEIYTIPSSSPVYNVTYVTQENPTETTVESSTTAGYYGMFVVGFTVGACVAYGTGWYYPPYMYYPPYGYPIYRPYPCAYGAGYAYNPWTGGYVGGRVAYGPYGTARSAAWYNPSTGRYGRAASVQTPWGGRSAASAYNPYTGGYASTRQGHNAYAQWGSSVAGRGNNWVQTGHVTTRNGTTAAYRTSGGQSGVIHRGQNGTAIKTNNGVYAGHDGNVYKKNADGGWTQYDKGNWNNVERNKPQTQNLNASENARQRGQQQTREFQNYQRHGGGGYGGGGFRGGGGGFRGGGRR